MQKYERLISHSDEYRIITYEEVLREISNSNLMFILTNELIRITESKTTPIYSMDLRDEQISFLYYLQKISNKKSGDYPNLVFIGNYIKVGVLFIKKSKKRLKYYLDKLEEYKSFGIDNVYLLSIGYDNTLFSKLIAKKFTEKSIYNFSWLQTLQRCPNINKRSIIRLSKLNDLDSTKLSLDEIDSIVIPQQISTELDVQAELKDLFKFITRIFYPLK